MKKLLLIAVMALTAFTAKAQFEQDTYYVNTSLTSFDFSYCGMEKTKFGVQGQGGYFIDDCVSLVGTVGLDIRNNSFREVTLGGGGRYYMDQNGIFLGAGLQYVHGRRDDGRHYNDFMPYAEIGYAFFVNQTLTIEPSIYYRQSLKDHSEYSKLGFKVGLGLYF